MITLPNWLIGFLRGLGVVLLTALLSYIGNADNIAFLSPTIATLIAAIALAIEHGLSTQGTAIFGSVNRA